MSELIQVAFSPVNLPYTVLMIVLVLYWLIVLVGMIDLDAFDLGGDAGDLDTDGGGSFASSFLGFFNVGEVPLVFYASIVALSMWVVSLQLNHYLEGYFGDYLWLFAIALAAPNLIFGLLVAKLVTTPLKWINVDRVQETPLVGKPCVVKSLQITERAGQCEIATGAAPIVLNACTRGGEVLAQGERAVIVDRDKKNNVFTVTRYRGDV